MVSPTASWPTVRVSAPAHRSLAGGSPPVEPLEPVLEPLPDEALDPAVLVLVLEAPVLELEALDAPEAEALAWLEVPELETLVPEVVLEVVPEVVLEVVPDALELERVPEAPVPAVAVALDDDVEVETESSDPAQASEEKHTAARSEDGRRVMAPPL